MWEVHLSPYLLQSSPLPFLPTRIVKKLTEENMKKPILILPITLLVLGGVGGPLSAKNAMADPPAAGTPADNTGKNVRDQSGSTKTPFDQSESETDRTLTQRVRQAVVADDSLSTNAKNIKIITVNGMVTLRGPVKSDEERQRVVAKAQQIAGEKNVDNQLEITGK
jgi:hyperosmotically inducible periplasmic protein